MKKAILTLLLVAMSTGALAEWVKAGESGKGEFYIDPDTARRDGQLRRIWEIFDAKHRDENGVASIRTLAEYDCNYDRYRTISLSTHSEPMAGGKTIFSNNVSGEWRYIPPGNGNARHILGFLCGK